MSEKMKKVLEVAQKTKNALYAEWDKNQKHFFEDGNNFCNAGRGILSESMGLTSVMLLLVRFFDNPEIYEKKQNDPKTLEIITTSLEYIYDYVFDQGYLVTPLRKAEDTKGVIDKTYSYVDTLTWVLSSSVLITYAIRQDILELDEALEKKASELMADSLARLLNGQLPCGAWGFSTDKEAKKSLYFTYAAAASIADFLDYIFGELEYYRTEENQKKNLEDFYDWKTVDEINNFYSEQNNKDPQNTVYPKNKITNVVAQAKSKLQEWLIKDCLPLLPKISTCTPLNDSDMTRLGVVKPTSSDTLDALGNKHYINLYYTFYIIDILTTSSSDKRFPEIFNGNDSITIDDLMKSYEGILSNSDYSYYFGDPEDGNAVNLFNDYINQAVHSARMNFSIAQRTGIDFWENTDGESELNITWDHESSSRRQAIKKARGSKGFTEPALVPMALRANAVYCFYIIESPDVTVDSLFELICNDRSENSEPIQNFYITKDLWDTQSYSLPVTERSIEAIVDYCDYLEDIDITEAVVKSDHAISSVDEAVQVKIEEHIQNLGIVEKLESTGKSIDEDYISKLIDEKVNALVDKKLEEALAGHTTNAQSIDAGTTETNLDTDEIIKLLGHIQGYLNSATETPNYNSDDPIERMAYHLQVLYSLLERTCILTTISPLIDSDENADLPRNVSKEIQDQFSKFIGLMAKNHDVPAGDIVKTYEKLI